MAGGTTIERPVLTLPEAEAQALRSAYERASVILEYGSGGSTVMAAEMPGKTVFSVESDADWADMMRGWFSANPPAPGSRVEVIWSDIGPTKEWGYPVDDRAWRRFARYPLDVWGRDGFAQPDVVLVDGRFRTGCAMATAFLTRRPVSLYVDDYRRRKQYHRIEAYLGTPRLIGRMAEFRVTPQPVPPARLMDLFEMMTQP